MHKYEWYWTLSFASYWVCFWDASFAHNLTLFTCFVHYFSHFRQTCLMNKLSWLWFPAVPRSSLSHLCVYLPHSCICAAWEGKRLQINNPDALMLPIHHIPQPVRWTTGQPGTYLTHKQMWGQVLGNHLQVFTKSKNRLVIVIIMYLVFVLMFCVTDDCSVMTNSLILFVFSMMK